MDFDIEVRNLEFSNSKKMSFNVRKQSFTLVLDVDKYISMNMFNIFVGLKVDYEGEIRYFGEKVVSRRRIGYISPRSDLDSDLSVYSQLKYWCLILGISNVDRTIDSVLNEVGIFNFKYKKITSLTRDDRVFVSIAGSILFNPDIILVNHTLKNFSIENQDKFIRMLMRFNKKMNKTILVASSDMDRYISIADDIFVIKNGEIIDVDEKRFDNDMLRYIEVDASPVTKLAVELESLGMTYFIVDKNLCHVYSDIEVCGLVEILVSRGISINSVVEVKENREDKIKYILETK